ncbi:MAG TPA: hypothetical protein VH478_00785, partial [Trebonia sp.]|nr:hypothetical protein [Trebonia sp.]
MTSLAGRLWERARRPGVIDRAAIADRIATRHERLVAPLPLAAVAGRYTGPAPEGGELPVARARPAPVERSRPDAAAPAPSGPPVIQLKALPSAPAPQPPAAPPLSVVTGHGGHYADGGPRPDSRPAPRLALVSALPPRLARPVPADAVPADAVPASPVPADLGPDTPGPASAGPAASGPAGSGPGPGRAQPGPPPTVLTPSPFSSPPPASLLADAPGPVGGLRAGP